MNWLMSNNLQVFYQEPSFIHVLMLNVSLPGFNMDWLVLWTLMHAFRWSTFSLLLAQKFQQAKTSFQHLQPKFFQ